MLCSKLEDVVPNTAAPTTLGFCLSIPNCENSLVAIASKYNKNEKKKIPAGLGKVWKDLVG